MAAVRIPLIPAPQLRHQSRFIQIQERRKAPSPRARGSLLLARSPRALLTLSASEPWASTAHSLEGAPKGCLTGGLNGPSRPAPRVPSAPARPSCCDPEVQRAVQAHGGQEGGRQHQLQHWLPSLPDRNAQLQETLFQVTTQGAHDEECDEQTTEQCSTRRSLALPTV